MITIGTHMSSRLRTARLRFRGLLVCATFVFSVGGASAVCPFSPDGAGATSGTATTDGLLFIRYALGLTSGAALGAGATQGGASPAAIASFIADPTNNAALDIDGDGKFSANDAMAIARYLFGFRGDVLATGLPAIEFAARYGGPALQTYLDNGCTGLNDLPDPRVVVWNAMNAALVAANASQAKAYLTPNGLANHGAPIDSLLPQMASIVGSYGPLVARVVSGDYAEYLVTRPLPGSSTGERQIFFVTFLQGPDGAWLIDGL